VNAPWIRCPSCDGHHRIGRACPPPVPRTVDGAVLSRVAAAYWLAVDAEMAEARSLEIIGLSACLVSHPTSTISPLHEDEPRVAWQPPRGPSADWIGVDMTNDSALPDAQGEAA